MPNARAKVVTLTKGGSCIVASLASPNQGFASRTFRERGDRDLPDVGPGRLELRQFGLHAGDLHRDVAEPPASKDISVENFSFCRSVSMSSRRWRMLLAFSLVRWAPVRPPHHL